MAAHWVMLNSHTKHRTTETNILSYIVQTLNFITLHMFAVLFGHATSGVHIFYTYISYIIVLSLVAGHAHTTMQTVNPAL